MVTRQAQSVLSSEFSAGFITAETMVDSHFDVSASVCPRMVSECCNWGPNMKSFPIEKL